MTRDHRQPAYWHRTKERLRSPRCPPLSLHKRGLFKVMSLSFLRDAARRVAAIYRSETEDGQTLVEYGLLLALIAIIVIVALLFLGPIVSQIFQTVGTSLQT
jgi:pilus assembly protein Flp/PilA